MKYLSLIAALMLSPALFAQNVQTVPYGTIYTPEIHLGSATEPSTITVPPVLEVQGQPAGSQASNAPPASTELLASRHFDFITSPLQRVVSGSMEDTSVSLGDYARRLRAERQQAKADRNSPLHPNPSPNSMSRPNRPD
jgi:hypothetical protein